MHLFKIRGYVPEGVVRNRREQEFDMQALPPFLRTLLVTDGTVTKSLEAFFWEEVTVETLDQHDVMLANPLTELCMTRGQHVLQRVVRLRGRTSGSVYALAKSHLNLIALDASLRQDLLAGRIGIGELLRESGLETYREILDVGLADPAIMTDDIGSEIHEPAVCRSYRIKVHRTPTIWITEFFPLSRYQN